MTLLASVLVTPSGRVEGAAALEESARLASALAAFDVGPDDVVALLMWNDVPFFTLAEACRQLGACLVPLNWHMAPPELRYILADSGAKVLFGHDALLRDAGIGAREPFRVVARATPEFVAAAYPQVEPLPRAHWPAGWLAWTELLADQPPFEGEPPPAQRGGMFYTSGTTGKPKAVVRDPLPPQAWAELHARSSEGFGLTVAADRPRVTVVTGPLYHSAPNAYAQLVWRDGGTVRVEPRFSAAGLLQQVARECVTHLHLVPTMLKRLLDLPASERLRHDLSSLVSVCHGAAPCPPELKRAAIAWLGPIVREYYAGTETGVIAWSTSAEWLARPGTIGRAAAGVQVRVIGADGRELARGETGELIAHSAATTSFRYHQRAQHQAVPGWDGFASLGDVGRIDADGYLFLSDRRSDMIISGGVNIYPAEIEAELLALPGVADCAVYGVPDAEFGEVVHAVVEPLPGSALDPAGLRATLRPRLAAYKIPHRIELRDALPRDDSGKIRKRLLRDAEWRALGRAI